MKIKTPLRYPGGKSRALDVIFERVPPSFAEFREPFVGGGSVFLAIRQQFPQVSVWINDLNYDLFCFWTVLQHASQELTQAIRVIKSETEDGKELFYQLQDNFDKDLSDFERAVRFFVLNRITFSGTVDSGGYSEHAFHGRFTTSSIDRLTQTAPLLSGVRITHGDYVPLLQAQGEQVFIFLDPPYLTATSSRLYGRKGVLHTNFDHHRFAENVNGCLHQWMITYDDAPELRQRFVDSHLYAWELQYGMNNYKQNQALRGRELLITNYTAQSVKQLQLLEPARTYEIR